MEIDQIDQGILRLLAQRFEVVQQIDEYKKQNDMQPLQKDRWQEILASKKKLAQEHGIKPDFVEKVWNNIHDYSLALQED